MSTARSCVLQCPAEEGTRYFEFPDENKQNDLRNEWIEILQINPAKGVHVYVCERHFSQRQRTQMGLKNTAVPDINLSFSPEFYEMEEPITDCDNQMSDTLHTNYIEDKLTETKESPTKHNIVDDNDLIEEQNSQKDQTKNVGKASSYYDAFLRNINEGIQENCAPAKILTTSNQIKGPLKLCTVDAQGNYIPVILKKFKICSPSVGKPKKLPIASHNNNVVVKSIQTPSSNIVNNTLATIQNKQPQLFSVLKEPSDTIPDQMPQISEDSDTPKLLTNNSIKVLANQSMFRIANTTISIKNSKKLNNSVPEILEKRDVLPHLEIKTPTIKEDSNSTKEMCTPNSNEINNLYETAPTTSSYLSSANTTTTPLSSEVNSCKMNNTNDELTRSKRNAYMNRVNNVIGSKITVTLKKKSPTEKTSLFRRISTEFDSDNAPDISECNNVNRERNATTSITKHPRAISYRCQFPLNVTLQDLSKQSTVINVIDDSTDDEVEFLSENSPSADTQHTNYSKLQTSSVLGDTDEEYDFLNDFMKPRKPRKRPKRIVGKRGSKINLSRKENKMYTRETLREYYFKNSKFKNSKEALSNAGRKTPPGLYSVLKEPSETESPSETEENFQHKPFRTVTKEKTIFCKSPSQLMKDHQNGTKRNLEILQSTPGTDDSQQINNSQSFNTSAAVTNSDQDIKIPLERRVGAIYSRYDNIPFTIDESMMVISRGVQASGDYRYRSPTRVRLEEDVKYLRRTLEEGAEALNTLKITTKNALEILAENDERITNAICAKLPKEVAKMVRESLSKKIPFP